MPFNPDDKVQRRDRGEDFSEQESDHLGSLAQKTRSKSLNNARNIMYVVAGLLALGLLMEWVAIEGEVTKVVREEGLDAAQTAELREHVNKVMLVITGCYIGLIVMYVVFGMLVQKYPVPITITGLVVFIAIQLVLAAIDPANLAKGIIVKIIVIVSLTKAIQAAIAYQKEKTAEESERRRPRDMEEDEENDR